MCPKIHKLFKSHENTYTQSGICGKKCQVLHSKAFLDVAYDMLIKY